MTVFHLVRHGEHVLAGRVLAGRTPGVGLSERGRAEIAAVAERFAGEDIAALYSSPLQRTKETAEILSARLDLPVGYREDVIELDFGDWTGLSFDQVRAHQGWESWRVCRSITAVPGGNAAAHSPRFPALMRPVLVEAQPGPLAEIEFDHVFAIADRQIEPGGE